MTEILDRAVGIADCRGICEREKQLMDAIFQYAGLPRAKEPGLSVQMCVERLTQLAYIEERLMFLQAVHIVTTPERDLKGLLSRLQYEDGMHSDQLKVRLTELRVAKNKALNVANERLKLVFDEAMYSVDSIELLGALTKVFKPALLAAYKSYLRDTNGLADYSSIRIIRLIVAEEEDGIRLLEAAYRQVVGTPEQEARAQHWTSTLQKLLNAVGGLDGTDITKINDIPLGRAQRPFKVARSPERDDSFPRVWDFVHVENKRVPERLVQMVCTRLGEVTIAEALAIVLWEVEDQPWSFYLDISRHMWDEMRHSLFGEAATTAIFGERSVMPIRDFEIDYLFKMAPLDLYAMLGIGVEAALMKYPPGKREEYEFCRDSARHPLMTTLQDFDWADEVLHVNIARRQLSEWYKGTQQELVELAENGMKLRAVTRHLNPPVAMPELSDQVSQSLHSN